MRAREFINETKKQADLPAEDRYPMDNAYEIMGLSSSVFYPNYRLSCAIARARSDSEPDDLNPYRPEWSQNSALGPHAVVIGASPKLEPALARAKEMAGIPGGIKKLSASSVSDDPPSTNTHSPVAGFKGYQRR